MSDQYKGIVFRPTSAANRQNGSPHVFALSIYTSLRVQKWTDITLYRNDWRTTIKGGTIIPLFLTNLALPEFCSSITLLANPIVTTDVNVERDTLCCNQTAPSYEAPFGT